MTKEDKITSYIGIYAIILCLICVVGLWTCLILLPPIMMVLGKPNWINAFALCYSLAVVLLPLPICIIYCGYKYIKCEIEQLKEEKLEKKSKKEESKYGKRN